MPGVYISYPFCAQKCTYCNFASGVLPRELEAQYVAALHKEISATQLAVDTRDPLLRRRHPKPNGAGDPRLTDPRNPRLTNGIDAGSRPRQHHPRPRTSLASRRHQPRQPRRPILHHQRTLPHRPQTHRRRSSSRKSPTLRAAGIANFNIDLIAGLPGQTPASWPESLDWVERSDRPPRLRLHAGDRRRQPPQAPRPSSARPTLRRPRNPIRR